MVNKEKRKINIRNIFYHNTFVLVFSFLCAVIIWFSVTASNTQDRPRVIYDIPISIQLSEAAQEEGIRVFSQSYSKADVSVVGSSVIVNKISADDLSVVASLSPNSTKLSGNTLVVETIPLTAQKKGNALADYEAVEVSPGEITVAYDKYKEATFKIVNEVKCTSNDGYYVSTPIISQESVVVSGPESAVKKVAKVAVSHEFTEPLTESKSFESELVAYDENGNKINLEEKFLTLSVESVDVDINVLSKQTVELDVTPLNMPQGMTDSRIIIEPETIDIAGEASVVSKYKTITLPDPIDFSTINLDNNVLEMDIPMPSSVKNVSNIDTATVTVNLNGFKETTLNLTNFKLSNVPEDKKVTIITKSLPVDVVGSYAQVNRLTSDSIVGTIDMAKLTDKVGNIDVPVTINVSGGSSCWAYGKYTVQVNIQNKTEEEKTKS